MSNSIVSAGYPSDYRQGISLIFWIILIIIQLSIGISLLVQSKKTHLVNRKELFLGNGFGLISMGLSQIIIQAGVYNPLYFVFFMSLAISLINLGLTFNIYYWEKNLINLKKIPTIYSFVLFIFSLIDTMYSLIYQKHIFEPYSYIFLILISTYFLLLGVITGLFAIKVIGKLRTRAFMIIFGYILFFIGGFNDHPPIVSFITGYVTILNPILFSISSILIYFGITGISNSINMYYNQERMCIIHRGKISKETRVFICPNCSSIYCQKCFELVIKDEGCWNCQEKIKSSEKVKFEQIQIVETENKKDVGKKVKHKNNK